MRRSSLIAAILVVMTSRLAAPAAEPEPSVPDASRETHARKALAEKVVRRFYAAYVANDLDAAMALWSGESPDRAERRKLMAELFESTESIQLKTLEFRRVEIEDPRAKVRVIVELTGLDRKTGQPSERLGKIDRVFELTWGTDGFRIDRYRPTGANDPKLLERLFAARNSQELKRIVQSEFDDEDEQHDLIFTSFIIYANAKQRQLLLRNDPFGLLARFSSVADLNSLSWFRLQKFAAGDPAELANAEELHRIATEVAEFIDHPEALAWCRLHRALILQAQGQSDEALRAAREAAAEFERLEVIEGQAAAQIVLGRLSVATGNKADAAASFATADRLFAGVVIFGTHSIKTLGETWALQRGEVERLVDAVEAARSSGDWNEARDLRLKAMAIEREIYGPWHESLVTDELFLAGLAGCRGDFPAGLAAAQSAMELARKVYEEPHPRLRDCQIEIASMQFLLNLDQAKRKQYVSSCLVAVLADVRQAEKRYADSLKLWDKVLQLRSAVLGENHVCVARTWQSRAKVCMVADDSAGALDNLRRFAELCAKAELTDDPGYLDALNKIAILQTAWALSTLLDADLQTAIEARDQVVEAFQRAMSPQRAEVVISRSFSQALRRLLDLSPADRAAVRQALADAADAIAGRGLNVLQAIEILNRCLEKLGPLFAEADEILVRVRLQLAIKYRLAKQFDRSLEQLLVVQQALERANLQEDGSGFSQVHSLLAQAYQQRGELRKASDALRILITALSRSNDLNSVVYRSSLQLSAELQWDLGEYAAAERDALRFLLLSKRRLLPSSHPNYYGPTIPVNLEASLLRGNSSARDYIWGVNELGSIQMSAGAYQRSRNIFLAALDLAEKLDEKQRQKENIDLDLMHSLSIACSKLAEWDEAETYLRRALDLLQARQGQADDICSKTFSLAFVLHAQGKFAEALKPYREVAAMVSNNPSLRAMESSPFWMNIAMCQAGLDDRQGAIDSLVKSLQAFDRHLDDVASFRSERGSQQAWGNLMHSWRCLATLALAPEASTADVMQTWNWSLRIKGRSLDTLVRYRQMQRRLRDDPAVAQLAERSTQLRNQISELALNPPVELAPAAVKPRIERLRTELDEVVGEINRAASRLSFERSDVSLAALRQKLPVDTALVEFVRISRCNWLKAGQPEQWSPERYVAFVLPRGRDAIPTLVDLGDAAPIDEKIHEVRELIVTTSQQLQNSSEESAEEEFQERSQELYQLVLAPLVKRLGEPHTIYVLPDSELQRVAFETLVDRPGHYLIEDYQFAYLSSAGDLLRPTVPPGKGTWVFAGPDYDLNAGERVDLVANLVAPNELGSVDPPLEGVAPAAEAVAVDRGGSWKRLPFAAEELQVVRSALEDSAYGPIHPFMGREALEDVLKTVHSPRILHLATHGFFVEDVKLTEDGASRGGSGASLGIGRLVQQQNPFLRSGLVLAGANRLGKDSAPGTTQLEDGWVTAEEIASLDLQGTELVVLSACETGLGDVKTGEGVQGLRQAFLHAGARTLVTSLYRVPDEATLQLMQEFYSGLKDHRGKLPSLREAQLNLLQTRRKKDGAAHPYFWGSFILVGNPQ